MLEQDAALTGEPPAGTGPAADVAASLAFLRPGGPAVVPRARRRIGVGVIGFGWLGRAHTRSLARIPKLFADRDYDPVLVVCADPAPGTAAAAADFGFERASGDWRRVIDDPAVDAVWIAAPNRLHAELVEAAAQAGKHVFCEKPVGGTPAETARAEAAVARAGVVGGVGFNYRWAPLVRYAAELIGGGELGALTNVRGRFFSVYGADPLGVLSWRYRLDEGGHGASSDLLSHAVDLAQFLAGPITRLVGTTATLIPGARSAPAPTTAAAARTTSTASHQRGLRRHAVRVRERRARQVRGEPRDRRAGEPAGDRRPRHRRRRAWDFEAMNELRVYRPETGGYTRVLGGERFPPHGVFVPGSANGIGYEDLVTIEDAAFCDAIAEGRPFAPGFDAALAWVAVQAALLRSGVGPLGGRVSVTAVDRCGSG